MTKASAGSSHRTQYTILNDAAPPGTSDKHFWVSRPSGDEAAAPLSLSNKHVQIWSSPESGLLQVRRVSLGKLLWLDFYHNFHHFFCFSRDMQKVRLCQSGVTHEVKVQFLWYGTRAGREKSGAYLFLPERDGARVSVLPGFPFSLLISESFSMCLIPPPDLFTHRPPHRPGVQWPRVLGHHYLFPTLHAQSSALPPGR